ncbi:MAG: VOC family protein [Dehalococcoidia bacterium]
MEQRISLVTLGVANLARSKTFYEALGWKGQEVEETVFIQAGGLVFVLWGAAKLAADAGLHRPSNDHSGAIVLAHNVRTQDEVDEVLAEAVAAGAVLTKAAGETAYGGYAGCFADPDGHVWEIAFNPGFPLAADGSISLPDFGTD